MKDGSEDHAVVLGGSIAGLLAARVLADAYDAGHGAGPRRARSGRRSRGGARRKAGTSTRCSPAASRRWTSCSPGSPTSSRRDGAPTGDMLGDARFLFGGHRLARTDDRAGLVERQSAAARGPHSGAGPGPAGQCALRRRATP